MELEFHSFDDVEEWLKDSMNACVVSNYTGYPIECSCGSERIMVESDSKCELKIGQLMSA
jgi:hypothetical protein